MKRRKRQEVEGLAREMRAERLVRRREASYRNWSQRRGWSPPAEPAFTDAAGSVTPSQPAISYEDLSELRCEHGINVFHCQVCGPKDHDDDVFVFDRSRFD